MPKKNFSVYVFTLLICGLVAMEDYDKREEALQEKRVDQDSYTVDYTSGNTFFAAKTVNKAILNSKEVREPQKKFYLLNFLMAWIPKNENIYLDDFFFRYGTGSIFLHGFAPYVEWKINEIVKEYYDVTSLSVSLGCN